MVEDEAGVVAQSTDGGGGVEGVTEGEELEGGETVDIEELLRRKRKIIR